MLFRGLGVGGMRKFFCVCGEIDVNLRIGMNKPLFSLLIALSVAAGADARLTAVDAFCMAPSEVMPMISPVRRAEMVKLFEAGVPGQASPNAFGGKVEVLEVSQDAITLSHATDATLTIALLPAAGRDTLLMTVETLPTPAPDSNVRIYTRDWKPLQGLYEEPAVRDWALKGRQAEASEVLPFMLAEGRWDPVSRELTLTPTIERWIDEETRPRVASMIRRSLVLGWNGRKFVVRK